MIRWNGFNFNFPRRKIIGNIFFLHDFMIIVLICVLFLVIFNLYFVFSFKQFNLTFLENHFLELVWTISPFLILTFVILASLSTLYFSDSCFFCGVNLTLIGHQWYWSYNIKNFGDYYFDSYIIKNFLRVSDVDNRLILPFNIPIRALARSLDVIHSWTIPSLGLKIDCIPGRLNQICFSFSRSGVFFGQCSEICGVNHRFIPIVVESINPEEFFINFSDILS